MISSMYNSIQHFSEYGVKNIEEKVKKFITEGKDLADLVFGLQADIFELGRNIVQEVLTDVDEYLRKSGTRKKQWEIVRRDAASLLTTFGTIKYDKTYFKPKKGGKREYLVDRIAGIDPHDRVSSDVVINAAEEAIQSNYLKGGKKAAFTEDITKQSVKNIIHTIEVKQPEIDIVDKKDIRILYIEADEDHVALQGKNAIKVNGSTPRGIIMPKLVYVHEGIDYEKSTQKRKVLKNVRYFGGEFRNSELLWLEVSEYIDEVYKTDSISVI
jgi:hypothetical protein